MGIHEHEVRTKSDRLIEAMEALTLALERLPEREAEYRRKLSAPVREWLTADEVFTPLPTVLPEPPTKIRAAYIRRLPRP